MSPAKGRTPSGAPRADSALGRSAIFSVPLKSRSVSVSGSSPTRSSTAAPSTSVAISTWSSRINRILIHIPSCPDLCSYFRQTRAGGSAGQEPERRGSGLGRDHRGDVGVAVAGVLAAVGLIDFGVRGVVWLLDRRLALHAAGSDVRSARCKG